MLHRHDGGRCLQKVLLATSEAFTEDEAFNISVGLTTCVMMYTGRDADGRGL